MTDKHIISSQSFRNWALFFALWAVVVWLLYPLLVIRTPADWNPEAHTLRSIVGLMMLILLLGKTIFDLFFPLESSKSMSWLKTIFLILYTVFLTTGIIYLAGRMVVLYFVSETSELFF